MPNIATTHHHQNLKPHLTPNRILSSRCSKHNVNHISLNDLPVKSVTKTNNITCVKCLSNLHEQHQQQEIQLPIPMARPASPNNFSILRRDKKTNKFSHEILDEYQDINYYINYEENMNTKKKKFIKIQDCTDWLEFKNNQKLSTYTAKSSLNTNSSANNIYRHYSANFQKMNLQPQTNLVYFQNNNLNSSNNMAASDLNVNLDISQQNLYRINILLNRRSARANT